MSSPNNLEISGDLAEQPMAELMVELLDAKLNGSVRLTSHGSKMIIYVRDGEVLFAVSNQRQHRIFQILLDANLITKRQLVDIPDFANDMVLAEALRENGTLPESEQETVITRQVETIIHEALGWKQGTWTFSPLARIKDDLRCDINIRGILAKHGREMPKEAIIRRFKSFKESFRLRPTPAKIDLLPREAFVMSRFADAPLKIEEINKMTGMSDSENLQGLYALWLAGYLVRSGWNSAFTPRRISEISSAHLELRKMAAPVPKPVQAEAPKPVANKSEPEPVETSQPVPEVSLESYLKQVEEAETHYESLHVPIDSSVQQLKQAYFSLAKRFHPDLHYKNADPVQRRRIQDAFTNIAHAYETLRNEETRLRYDYRLKAILEELKRQGKVGVAKEQQPSHKQMTEASEIFDHGFNMLMDEDYEAALPYLTRAVSMAPDVARYHAYYGKALSADRSQKFKAESELQTAIKLDPENPMFRLLLAEFFVEFNLLKRAEGELKRLLVAFPDNAEARAMLDSLQ